MVSDHPFPTCHFRAFEKLMKRFRVVPESPFFMEVKQREPAICTPTDNPPMLISEIFERETPTRISEAIVKQFFEARRYGWPLH